MAAGGSASGALRDNEQVIGKRLVDHPQVGSGSTCLQSRFTVVIQESLRDSEVGCRLIDLSLDVVQFRFSREWSSADIIPVSYTHLTLPTIYSV